MGLMSALQTGVSGLMSHQSAMDNIGNNLANINNFGYKAGQYQFSTLLSQSLSGASGSTGSRGSVNAVQLGMGSTTGSIKKLMTQGNLETTGALNDMAIYGNGFFVVDNGGNYALTRNGSFYLDENGTLCGGTGYFVQGTLAVQNSEGNMLIPQDCSLSNITIPIGTIGGHSQSTKASFAGNLDSAQDTAAGTGIYSAAAAAVAAAAGWVDADPNDLDTTWTALNEQKFVVTAGMIERAEALGISVATGTTGSVDYIGMDPSLDYATHTYYAIDPATGQVVNRTNAAGEPEDVNATLAAGYIPVMEQVTVVNGGSTQTSDALGVKVPEYLMIGSTVTYDGLAYTVNNNYTLPAWYYDANGGDFTAVVGMTDAQVVANPGAAWPNGHMGSPVTGVNQLPVPGETYPASLNTPLEHLYSFTNGSWKQLFAGVKDGEEIVVSFDKGEGRIEAAFIYQRPNEMTNAQSYTLEHFLTFLGGDVNNAAAAGAVVTPAMFGAPVTAQYPNGDITDPAFNKAAYEAALADASLLANGINTRADQTGAMGLVDVAAYVSTADGGDDPYSAPLETAGAYTREGVGSITYQRWNSVLNSYEDVVADSFNVSFVSNLGDQNRIDNIAITYNQSANRTLFNGDVDYGPLDGGSAVITVPLYDSLGNAKTATIRLALVDQDTDGTTWRWYADSTFDTDFDWQVDEETGRIISSLSTGTGLIRFDQNGNFVAGSDYSETGGILLNQIEQGVVEPLKLSIVNGLNPRLKQDLDWSELTSSADENSLVLETQNGAPPGALESYTVAADGTIYGYYSTGVEIPIARLVLGMVTNEHGLLASSDNLYYETASSGSTQYGYAEVGGRGAIRQYQLETSNVDMSIEFTKLISTERGFQANSRVITTADEMLQEVLNLKR